MEPGKTVVICKISKPDAISKCGLAGSFANTSLILLLTNTVFVGIQLNCELIGQYSSHYVMIALSCYIACTGDDIILQSPRIPPGTYDLYIQAKFTTLINEMRFPIFISKQNQICTI